MPVNPDKRIQGVIDQLNYQFEHSPYFLGAKFDSPLEQKDELIMSVVIPARNEFPNVVHTCYSIWHAWEAEGHDPAQIEIIIVANCCTDFQKEGFDPRKPGDKGTTEYLMARGGYWARKIRVLYDPVAGNHSARNKGAAIARGKYVFFSDAHMAYKPGFFTLMMETIDKTGGMFHGVIAWMGAYPPHGGGLGCGYTLKLGEEIKGTWNNYFLSEDKMFYIPALGHCSVGALRDQFIKFGGYPNVHRSYGGGEFYINMKWWMFGSSVSTHPKAIGYHLASGRGYTWNHDDYLHNVFNIGYALGMDDWLERAYINCLRKGRKEVLDRMMAEAKIEAKEDRKYIEQHRKMTFNELLVKRPWKTMNEELHGKGLDNILIYHDSWIDYQLKEAPEYVQKMYHNSETQKKLAKFIDENLGDFVYKRKKK